MGKYKREVTAYLLDHLDVIDVVGSVVPLKRAGRNHKGLCPFHNEKSPSFVVSDERQTYHCFGCGASGSAINFVMQSENLGFLDALEQLAERYSVDIAQFLETDFAKKEANTKDLYDVMKQAARLYYQSLTESKEAKAYFQDRGLSEKVMKQFGLGFAPDSWDFCLKGLKKYGIKEEQMLSCGLIVKKENGGYYDRFRNRVMFPIFDHRGRVVAFGGRVLDDSVPKYLNSPETPIFYKSNTLYGLNVARKSNTKENRVILVEGYMDVITLHQYGYVNTVASLGTALTEGHVKQLSRLYKEVIFAYDGDEAGRNAIIKSLDVFKGYHLKVKVLDMGDVKDPDELLKVHGKEGFDKQIDLAMNTIEFSVKRLEKGYNLKDDEDRLQFLSEAYKMIAGLTSDSEREVYLNHLAERIGLSAGNVIADFNREQGSAIQVEETAREHHHDVDEGEDDGWYGVDFEPPEDLDGEDLSYEISDTPLINTSKLLTIEKAVLKSALMSKGYVQIIETQLQNGFYYEANADLFTEIKRYYSSFDAFEIMQAAEYFAIEQVKKLKEILFDVAFVGSSQDVEKLLKLHKKLYYEARIKEVDSFIQKLKMTPGDDANLKYREKLVERIKLQKELSQVTKLLQG
ncbi:MULTISPECIES: DNA primase [unclassified Fusibacter]|uniref:DNA primase n=1 Tax=unclassified Fusibacter TaxID=2624464 RepID=UPI0013E8FC30|nr:DNA primase [Fusibacter sp. A1]MCK8058119.1 DNA primase [Fusibacter sp. A2]NPE20701.1 DNA primase [Fusibacter sp. A1]